MATGTTETGRYYIGTETQMSAAALRRILADVQAAGTAYARKPTPGRVDEFVKNLQYSYGFTDATVNRALEATGAVHYVRHAVAEIENGFEAWTGRTLADEINRIEQEAN